MDTVTTASKNFIFHCKFEKGLSSKTIRSYTSDINQFISFLDSKSYSTTLDEIDKFVLKEYLKLLSKWKPKTIKRKVATLKALFNFLEFEDEIIINPFRKIRIQIKESKKLPSVLNISDVYKIFKSAYNKRELITAQESYAFREVTRDIAILELLFATGIRVSELCTLKTQNIDSNFRCIMVQGKGDKERIIQVCNKETITALKMYQKAFKNDINKIGYFFINKLRMPISDQSVRLMVKKYSRIAKIKKTITPHTFRHTFATLLLEEGVDLIYIQHLLGHSSIMTTQIYTHVNQVKLKRILSTKHPRKKIKLVESI